MDEAFNQCLRNGIDFLERRAGMTRLDPYGLCSVAVSFRVIQVVDINKGVHAMIPKDIFAADLRASIRIAGPGRPASAADPSPSRTWASSRAGRPLSMTA